MSKTNGLDYGQLTALRIAVYQAGSAAELSKLIGKSPSYVSRILSGKQRLTAEVCKDIETAVNVPRVVLLPEIFE